MCEREIEREGENERREKEGREEVREGESKRKRGREREREGALMRWLNKDYFAVQMFKSGVLFAVTTSANNGVKHECGRKRDTTIKSFKMLPSSFSAKDRAAVN